MPIHGLCLGQQAPDLGMEDHWLLFCVVGQIFSLSSELFMDIPIRVGVVLFLLKEEKVQLPPLRGGETTLVADEEKILAKRNVGFMGNMERITIMLFG